MVYIAGNVNEDSTVGDVQVALDVVGFVPIIGSVADLLNAGVAAAGGDWVTAGINVVAAIPIAGDAFKAGKMAGKASAAAKKLADASISVAITTKLSREASDALRTSARDIWQATTGRRAIWDNLQVHHRIPLEWSHLFPKADPNRLSNLVGINSAAHTQVTNAWNAWKLGLNGRIPTQAEIMEQALRIDELFKNSWVFPK